jgi:predicted ArsR family transcriptional regulator
MVDVLECLRNHGQRLDLEIADETGLPLETVRQRLMALVAAGDIIMCRLTRFKNGVRTEAWQCRVSGFVPPRAPGRKAPLTPPY